MPRIHIPRRFGLTAALLAVACTADPIVSCACSPPLDVAVVHGRVTMPGGGAAAGATVRVQIGPPGCQPWADARDETSGANGEYELLALDAGGQNPDACRRVFALPPAGSGLRGSDTVPLVVRFRAGPPLDSVRIDLALRAP